MIKRVEVYLDRRAMGKSPTRIYSIRDAQSHTVWTKNSFVLLRNVELVVQPKGREATLERLASSTKITRTVHAFLRGELVRRGSNAKKYAQKLLGSTPVPVGYDPHKTDAWVVLGDYKMPQSVDDLPRIYHAETALLHKDGIQVALSNSV